MRTLIFLSGLLFLMSISCYSQETEFKYSVTILGKKGSPLSGIKVWMHNKNTGEIITKQTPGNGNVNFTLGAGFWTLNLPGMPDYKELDVTEGRSDAGSAMFSYDKEKIKAENEIIVNRNKINFIEENQKNIKITSPQMGFCIAKIKLVDNENQPVVGLSVVLVSVKQQKKYLSETDQTGIAKFHVPIGETYAVDVDGIKNFAFTGDLFATGTMTLEESYVKTSIKETIKNDTITQTLADDVKPTSARVLLNITVSDKSGNVIPEENIYLQQLASNFVYKTKTDDQGVAVFLLPKGEKYMIHFDYEKDIDVVNFSKIYGRGNSQINLIYSPDPKLQFPEQYIPKPEELFLEEFQNFMTNALPEPQNKKVELFFKWGNKVNSESKEAILEIGISAKNTSSSENSSPFVDLAFVIDRSGSMEGYDRIEALKQTMMTFVDRLRPDDNVCLVTFNSDAFIDMPLQKRASGKELKNLINEIEPGGFTNIYNGMVLGYEQLLKSKNPERIKQLILLTDGYGETEPKIVVDKSKEYNAKGLGISAIGVGLDYNYALLKLLTDEQGGLIEHAGESKDIYKAFENQFAKMIFPVAKEAKLDIIFNDKIRYNQLYGAKPETSAKSKDRISIRLDNLYSGYNKLIIAQFDLLKPDQTIENEPVVLELSYIDLETNKLVKEVTKAHLEWESSTGKMALIIDMQQKKLYAIAVMNQSIKVMVDAFVMNDIPKAKYAIERAMEQVKELFPHAEDKDIEKLIGTMANYAKAIDNTIRKNLIEENKK
ncbi:MAG: VWA domain-containing protein [Bacteroidota bacterium]